MRAVGANARAARFAGISVNTVVVKTALLSGALAGLAGVGEVAGRAGYLTLDMSPGYGYSGIVIAMLAGLNPLGVVLAALFVAGLIVGADSMSRAVAVPDLPGRRDRRGIAAVDAGRSHAGPLQGALVVTEVFDIVASIRLLGRGAAHRHATDLRYPGRAAVRALGRAQSRHRRHHGRGRVLRLARGVPRRRAVDRRAGGCGHRRAHRRAARTAHRRRGAFAARDRTGDHAVRHQPVLLRLPGELSEGGLATDREDLRGDALVRRAAWHRTHARRADAAHPARVADRSGHRLRPVPHPGGVGGAHGWREPGGGRGAGHQRDRGAHRRHRRGQRADGRGGRLSHAVGVQRLLLQHGQRARVDLRGAGGVRILAAWKGAARGDPVRRLRRVCSCACSKARAGCCPTRSI